MRSIFYDLKWRFKDSSSTETQYSKKESTRDTKTDRKTAMEKILTFDSQYWHLTFELWQIDAPIADEKAVGIVDAFLTLNKETMSNENFSIKQGYQKIHQINDTN